MGTLPAPLSPLFKGRVQGLVVYAGMCGLRSAADVYLYCTAHDGRSDLPGRMVHLALMRDALC